MWAQAGGPTDLSQNPVLGGSLLVIAVGLLGLLIRTFWRSDGRWERLTGAQEDELHRTTDRLTATEEKAEQAMGRAVAAEARAAAAELSAARAETALEQRRAIHVRDQLKCEADLAELRRQLVLLRRGT